VSKLNQQASEASALVFVINLKVFIVMLYSQCNPPAPQSENIDKKELGVLDKVSITKVTEFMQKFQDDATFSPPTLEVLYDTDQVSVNIDDEPLNLFESIEDIDVDEMRVRAKSNNARAQKE